VRCGEHFASAEGVVSVERVSGGFFSPVGAVERSLLRLSSGPLSDALSRPLARILLVLASLSLFVSALVAGNAPIRTEQSLPSLVEVIAEQEGVTVPDVLFQNPNFGEATDWACGSLLNPRSFSASTLLQRTPICDAQMSQRGVLVAFLAVSGVGVLALALWAKRSTVKSVGLSPAATSRPAPPTAGGRSRGPQVDANPVFDQLARLAALHDRGAISATEFELKKAELLRRI
jgi:hypothetical protein